MRVIKSRKAQKPFINKEISINKIKQDYDKYRIRLELKRGLS